MTCPMVMNVCERIYVLEIMPMIAQWRQPAENSKIIKPLLRLY